MCAKSCKKVWNIPESGMWTHQCKSLPPSPSDIVLKVKLKKSEQMLNLTDKRFLSTEA